jgi:transposase-like protein
MPVLSHLPQLFHADTCDAYIHTLRWQDRPRQCPRCQSHNTGPGGTYHDRPGLKRYRCKACRRTFNDLTQTLLAQSKRSLAHWLLATLPGRSVSISARAITGVGGCAILP